MPSLQHNCVCDIENLAYVSKYCIAIDDDPATDLTYRTDHSQGFVQRTSLYANMNILQTSPPQPSHHFPLLPNCFTRPHELLL
jgi:hypothetical protein